MNQASPSPEVMPHGTSAVAERHPLALHFVPRSSLSTRNLLALARFTPKVAAAATTAKTTRRPRPQTTTQCPEDSLRRAQPEGAAAAATAKIRHIARGAASARDSRALSRVQASPRQLCSHARSQPSKSQGQDRRGLRTSRGAHASARATR